MIWVLVIDETGPVRGIEAHGDLADREPKTVEAFLFKFFPNVPRVGWEWAERPRDYSIGGDVLLIKVAGTHAIPRLRRMSEGPGPTPLEPPDPPRDPTNIPGVIRDLDERDRRNAKLEAAGKRLTDRQIDEILAEREATEGTRHAPRIGSKFWRPLPAARPPPEAPVDVEIVHTCHKCSRTFTDTTRRELPLNTSRTRREGFTELIDVQRWCLCGEPYSYTTTRLLPE